MIPLLQLVLPGEWAQAPLSDEVRVARVLELLSGGGADVEGVRSRVRELAAAGGDQLFLQLGSSDPTVVLTAWSAPSHEEPEGEEIAHRYGYRVLRTAGPGRASYWLVHPISGRVLALAVIGTSESAAWDELVGTLTWEEPESSVEGDAEGPDLRDRGDRGVGSRSDHSRDHGGGPAAEGEPAT